MHRRRTAGKGQVLSHKEREARHPVSALIREVMPPEVSLSADSRRRMLQGMEQACYRRALGCRCPKRLWPAVVAGVLVAIAALAGLALAIPFNRSPEPAAPRATIAFYHGRVEFREPGAGWAPVETGLQLTPGITLRTSTGAAAGVEFPDGSLARVTDESEIEIRGFSESSVDLYHVSGGTYHRTSEGSQYLVASGELSARAAGGAFNLENRVPGCIEVLSVRNEVEVEIGKHRPVKVDQGEVLVLAVAEKKADRQPVSRERLKDERLVASVQEDAREGHSTGIYERVSLVDSKDRADVEEPVTLAELSLELRGSGSPAGAALNWSVIEDVPGGSDMILALLRSGDSEPVYPDNEIAVYLSPSITSARDDGIVPGQAYQYRLVAVIEGKAAAYSNTLIISTRLPEPEEPSIELEASVVEGGVLLEWSVAGAARFDGYLVERKVVRGPGDSSTPAGTVTMLEINSSGPLESHTDTSVRKGHSYSYRVAVLVDGMTVAQSPERKAEL